MSFSADVEVPHCSNLVIVMRLCLFLLLVLFPTPSNLHGLGLGSWGPPPLPQLCPRRRPCWQVWTGSSCRQIETHPGLYIVTPDSVLFAANAALRSAMRIVKTLLIQYTWPSGACFHAASEGLVYSTMPLSWLLSRWFRSTPGMAHLWSNLTWKLC